MKEDMEFTDEGIVIDREPNALDEIVRDVTTHLEECDIQYAIVSGYVAVLFGRARATEDIDLLVEQFDQATATTLVERLESDGFWGPAMPLSELYETVSDGLPVRIAAAGNRVPNVELKFARSQTDYVSLENTVDIQLRDITFAVGSLELQIAYKLDMGAQKDFEDALYLFELLGQNLNQQALEQYVDDLGVESAYERLEGAGGTT